MKAKKIKEDNAIGTQQVVSPDGPVPTPRQRLHANIQRLLVLDKQLYWDPLEEAELLLSIQLVGFKVQHLAWQLQKNESLDPTM
jgi:hypothetical protein